MRGAAASASTRTATPTTEHSFAKCLECGRTFILEPKGPLHDDAFKEQVVRAYQDRMSLRGITRTFGVYYKTILKWAGGKKGRACRRSRTRSYPARRATCSSWMNFGALWAPSGIPAGGGSRFVGARARLWPTRSGIAALESAFLLREALPIDYARRATRSDFKGCLRHRFPW